MGRPTSVEDIIKSIRREEEQRKLLPESFDRIQFGHPEDIDLFCGEDSMGRDLAIEGFNQEMDE